MKILLASSLLLSAASLPGAVTLVNGDFEAASPFTGWTGTGGTETTTPLEGSTSASLVNQGIHQDFSDANDVFDFQLDFMVSLDSLNETQRVRVRGNGNFGDLITMRFNAAGIDTFIGGGVGWGNRLSTTIASGTDYHVRVTGSEFDLASRSYTLGISTDGVSYTTSPAVTAFHSSPVGTGFETIRVEGGSGGADFDAISITVIPEPSVSLLSALAGLGLLARRRR